ncbi:hypothetical protein PIROE2DRAFT_10347 [Piromyces sp. E2]|nr:hypothetical protein PIROE2DRAFT_10347 [Piromyces sp. E2]|eukprot:OUM63187.1 hypothetical protein PIROE2DRAFT_10347 [Piromyces sp. E2]
MNIKNRNHYSLSLWNSSVISILSLFILVKRGFSTTPELDNCECAKYGNNQYSNAYCLNSNEISSYNSPSFDDVDDCTDESSFEDVTSIPGISSGWAFFDNDGNLLGASSSTVPSCIYSINDDEISAVPSAVSSDYIYFLNKLNGVKIYKYTSDDSISIDAISANKGYISDDGVIFCSSTSSCEYISIKDLQNPFYIGGDDPKTLIVLVDGNIDKVDTSDSAKAKYYVNKIGNANNLINCSSGTCSIFDVVPRDTVDTSGKYAQEGYYLGGTYNEAAEAIIKSVIQCSSDYGCDTIFDEENTPTVPDTTEESFFLNAGATKTTKPLIQFADTSPTPTFTEEEASGSNVYYLNGGPTSNRKPLIYCSTKSLCEESEGDENYFYLAYEPMYLITYDTNKWDYELIETPKYVLNGGADKYDKPLIFCDDNNICSSIVATANGYYINNGSNALIYCKDEHTCSNIGEAEEGFYINSQNDKTTNPLIRCSDGVCDSYKPTKTGYFLDQSNSSGNKYEGLIFCSSVTSCSQMNVVPGYFVNSGSEIDEIIECQTFCVSKPSISCVGVTEKKTVKVGTYCYDDDVFSFVYNAFEFNDTKNELDENEKDLYLVSVSNDDSAYANYIYTTVEADAFPGITKTITTLFMVTKSSITQVVEDGVVAINSKTNIRLSSYSENININSKVNLYKCEISSKMCIPLPSCEKEMYIYDSKNQKGLYCNGSNLISITEPGYYIDGSRTVNKYTPYVLNCNSTGRCQSITPSNEYILNAGFDNSSNKLIYCSNGDCNTVNANTGYYFEYEKKGVIQCTSSNRCVYQDIPSFRYYVNAGAINSSKVLIQCISKKCSAISPNIGYYITHSPSILINCESRSECTEVAVTDGYYSSGYKGSANSRYIIHCVSINGNINCGLETTTTGAYVSNNSNILVLCDENKCETIKADIGTYISASSSSSSARIRRNEEGMDMIIQDGLSKRSNNHNLITCDSETCKELSPSELALVPICTFNNNKCFISYDYSLQSQATTTLSAGNYCTNANRSKLYFATDAIVVESSIIGATSSTFLYTTTNTNCVEVSKAYKNYYFTVGPNIYHLDDSRITLVVKAGYYFINIIENTLANGRDIDEYNDSNTKIYKCNDSVCNTIDKLKTDSYFADVNKKIIKYSADTQKFSFPYQKDILCIYDDNKCTPKYDMIKQEFCITYMGEIALITDDVLSRESVPCYKSTDVDNYIYGLSNYLYKMNGYSATLVDNTGYHIITKSTNFTAEYKDYTNKSTKIMIYGCIKKLCKIYTPKEKVYYYDSNYHSMYRLVNGVWEAPSKGGFAYISISPLETFVYKFSITNKGIVIENKVKNGFYYTVDKEMYECSLTECKPISDSGYVFTNIGEIYYCEWDSEELEETVCRIQACNTGEYYYIDGYYYRCDSGSILNLMGSKNCVYSAKYIINFPTILSDDYPAKVRNAVDKIHKNNNSTATTKNGRNYLPVVPAVYTNCTYNFEDKEATFDLICVKNFVKLNYEEEPEICSVSNMGYIYCSDESDNPNKCSPSSAFRTLNISLIYIIISIIITFFFFNL